MDCPQNFQRPFRISNRITDEGGLVGSGLAFLVAGTGIPGRRDDALVILDLAILNNDPVRQQTARGLMDAHTALLTFREHRRIEYLQITLADVVYQQLPVFQCQIRHHAGTDGPGGVTTDG